ncbi:hypothetical protein WOLCODRAFT_149751 [Wolfiporia cocos MD-104 SS10]|uniref:Uncharacterized protein n=1 Tax=Wolfiporia cocos (strain MD-104) TaxID=742152 RepID=A0A2H3JSS6_WOLCO|nr:hypothetical protein WOLCODRAFT_149751 [Wolfiporia cocos MD-104 SS10]
MTFGLRRIKATPEGLGISHRGYALSVILAAHQVDVAPAPTRDTADAPHIPAPAVPVLPPVPAGDAARAAAGAAPPLAEQVPAPVAPSPPAARSAALPPLVGEPPAHTLGPLAPPVTNLFASPEELAAVRAAALSSADDGKVTPIPPIQKGSPLELGEFPIHYLAMGPPMALLILAGTCAPPSLLVFGLTCLRARRSQRVLHLAAAGRAGVAHLWPTHAIHVFA